MTVQIEHMKVEANGQIFQVAACGPANAPPLLMLHGFPEGWLSWRPVMEALGDRYRIYAPDLRGYGGSSKPLSGYDVISLSDDVAGLMDALHLEKPVLVGHDWGGALAWVTAHRFSERLRKLIIVNCTHPKTMARAILGRDDGQHRRSWYMAFFQIPKLPELLLSAKAALAIRQNFSKMAGRKESLNHALVAEIAVGFRSAESLRGPVNYYRAAVRSLLVPAERQRADAAYRIPIRCPVTMIWGDADKALSMQVARKSGGDAGCPVEFRVLPGVGHFVSLEAPQDLAEEIDRAAKVTTQSASMEANV